MDDPRALLFPPFCAVWSSFVLFRQEVEGDTGAAATAPGRFCEAEGRSVPSSQRPLQGGTVNATSQARIILSLTPPKYCHTQTFTHMHKLTRAHTCVCYKIRIMRWIKLLFLFFKLMMLDFLQKYDFNTCTLTYHVHAPPPFPNCCKGLNGPSWVENLVRVSCDLHNESAAFLFVFHCPVTFPPHCYKNAGKDLAR